MLEILFSALVIFLVVTGMAVGVIAGRKPIQGSCGGLGAVGLDADCEFCGGERAQCEQLSAEQYGAGRPALPRFPEAG